MTKPVIKIKDLTIDNKGWLQSESGLIPIARVPSPHYTKHVRMVPDTIICHWTAGVSAQPAIRWFKHPRSKVSAHFIIDRQGRITQCVSTSRRSWHAGRSSWRGRKSCNGFSVGIELVNPGPVVKIDANTVRLRNDKFFSKEEHMGEDEDFLFEEGGKTYLRYPDKQTAALRHLMVALMRRYDIQHIVGHQDVAPKRKIDPGPELNYERLQSVKRTAWKEYHTRTDALEHINRAREPKPIGKRMIFKVLNILGLIPEGFMGVNRKDRKENNNESK